MTKNKQNSNNQPCVYVYEASAGSGKTYALARHYIKLLLAENSDPKQIENILAITFTNKAAGEMKERILEALRGIALDESANEQAKALELMDYIIANYDFFQIQTIDSFIKKILASCAFRLDISSNFEIKDDYGYILSDSLDECIDRASHDKSVKELFKNFLRQYLYLENKTGWMPKKDILNLIDSMFSQKNIYGKNFRKFDLKGENILISKRRLLKGYQSLNAKMTPDINGTFRKTLSNFVENNKDSFDFADTAKKSFLRDELPVLKNKTVPKELNDFWKEIRDKSSELAEKESVSFFNCYIDIFDTVYEIFRANARKKDVLFLAELNERAHSLIKKNELDVPELYYRLATRVRHFLIDEFQDTSVLQWQNLELMVEEILSTGGSFFCVGDKKQAIFRFRGGDTVLFDEIKNRFPEYVRETFLNINYRSQKEIVEFANSVFEKENLRRFIGCRQSEDDTLRNFSENDIEEIINIFARAKQEYRKDEKHQSGLVRVEAVEIADKEEKYEIIKEKLLNLIERFKTQNPFGLKDAAILCRENQDVELISGWLIDKNIPVESEKTLNIKNNPFILELISFLKFLNSPIDNLSFASFIMGEIFTKAAGIAKVEIQNFLFGLRRKDVYIYLEFQNIYPGIWDKNIGHFFKTAGFTELYEFITDIYKKFDVFKNFPEQQAFFMHFIELIKENEQEYNGITDFLDYFKGLNGKNIFINAKDMDAIKILTTHKSKGLGFGTVIIPFLEFDKNSFRSNKNRHISFIDRDSENPNISLVRLDKKYAQLSNRIAYIFKEEHKKSFIDELNTLYVALTRAENELYIFVPFSEADNIARHLIPEKAISVNPPLSPFYKGGNKESSGGKTSSITLSPPEYKEWIGFIKEEFSDANSLKNRSKILKGKILHQILSSVGNLELQDLNAVLKNAVSKTQILFPHVTDYSEPVSVIANLVKNNDLKKFFYVPDGMVYLEKEIVDRFGNTKRIDRLIVKENEVWIVEYKTKLESSLNYKEQIDNYAGLIKELFPKKHAKGFAMFLEEAAIEKVASSHFSRNNSRKPVSNPNNN